MDDDVILADVIKRGIRRRSEVEEEFEATAKEENNKKMRTEEIEGRNQATSSGSSAGLSSSPRASKRHQVGRS